ncbi:MAG: DUF4153 domain-containing protein [Anaerolineaceae bacterium]
MKKSSLFLIAGLIVAWAMDILFYKKPFGIAFTIWIVLALVLLFLVGALEKVKPTWQTIFLAVLTGAFSLGPLFRVEPFTRLLSSVIALIGLMLVAATYQNGYWIWFRIIDYITQFFTLVGASFSRALAILFPPKDKNEESAELTDQTHKHRKNAMFWSIFRGIGLALPVIFIFAVLLAAADPIFENRLTQILNFFKIENLVEYLFRFFYILLFAYIFTGVFLHAIYPNQRLERPDPNKPWIKTFLGNIETSIVLSGVNILFFTFLLIQFRYFFGGKTNISLSGYTYSEYARRGFGELIAVAVISLLLYLALNGITTNNSRKHAIRFTALSAILFVQVLIILYSGFQRLALYESAYGFSRLRTYSTVFIPWLAFLIVAVVALEIIKKQGMFPLALMTAILGFTASMIFINVDSFIASKNIQRAMLSNQEGYALDYTYLSQLSNDALPVIMDAYKNKNEAIRNPSAAFLACRWNQYSNPNSSLPWQGFNFPDQITRNLLRQNQAALENFPISSPNEYGAKFITIGNQQYDCYPQAGGLD